MEVHLNAIESNTLDYSLKFSSPLHNHTADRFTRELIGVLQEIDEQLLSVNVELGLHGWIDLFIVLRQDEGGSDKHTREEFANKVLQVLGNSELSAKPNRSRFAARIARVLNQRDKGFSGLSIEINPLPRLPLAVTEASALQKHH